MSETIRHERLLKHPPARVWRALTEPALVGRWLMPAEIRAEVGHRFHFDTGGWGVTQCEVLEVVPEQRLVYTWRNPPLDTTVSWTLIAEGEGTRLVLEHGGFDLDHPQQRFAWQGMGGGWGSMLDSRLPAVLAELGA